MSNRWVDHVKNYAKEHNIPYGCAVSRASASYREKYNIKPKKTDKKTDKKTKSLDPPYEAPEYMKRNAFTMAKKGGFKGTFEEYIR